MRQLLDGRVSACSTALLALATMIPACQTDAPDSAKAGSEVTGSIQAAITVGGLRHDVTAIHYAIVDASGTCSDRPIVELTSPLEDEAIPGSVLPPGAGTHAGADGLFVLPPGDYLICATPLSGEGPSLECAPAEATATVVAETTTEVVLISQCSAATNGGLGPVVVLNDPPTIEDIDVSPSKFITQCESATITVSATDPDGDALSATWELIAGAGTLSSAGDTATFTPSAAGDATVRVTVTDVAGGSASFTMPIHVSAAVCEAACTVFGEEAFGYVGCSGTEAVPSCDDITLSGGLSCSDDDCVSNVALPFTFVFYGTLHDTVDISSNGLLSFNGNSSFSNSCVLPSDTIAPFWDDLFTPGGGAVRFETLGTAPARRFVVQWNNPHITGGSLFDVRAVLFEGSNDIRYCYVDTSVGNGDVDSGASATSGISGAAGSLLFSCDSPQLTDGLVVNFTHPAATSACDPTTDVDFDGHCYYLDGSGGVCDAGFTLAPQSVLNSIAPSFVGKNYKHLQSGNCCIAHSDQATELQDWGMDVDCNATSPFIQGPTLGGTGCTDANNNFADQLTLCVSL